jgi:hypothetical protein
MKGIAHIKTTIIGIVLLLIAVFMTLLPFHKDIDHEASIMLLSGLYFGGVFFIILDPESISKALQKVLGKYLD